MNFWFIARGKIRPVSLWAIRITNWGWNNFQSWIHAGHDNYLMTPNGRIHRLLTRLSTELLFHPFQAFMFGQKFLAPKMRILLEDVFHGNYVTPFILRISVLSIVYAGVSWMSFLMLNGAFQCSKSERIQFFCSSEQVWLPHYSLRPYLLIGIVKNQNVSGALRGTYPNLFPSPQLSNA